MAPSNQLDKPEQAVGLEHLVKMQPFLWLNPSLELITDKPTLKLKRSDMLDAAYFMEKYTTFIQHIFPETQVSSGQIISPLYEIKRFQAAYPIELSGRLLLKGDHALPVAGSVKARGGFFEILQFAHRLCVENRLIDGEGFADFSRKEVKDLFSKYTVGVGSTGNLGLSIGIISANMGFQVKVYMSHDAKEWKKELLRQNGAMVMEEDGDFSVAIAKGRQETHSNPYGYFVDDENSKQLFLGYSLAAIELKKQFDSLGISIDKTHPLFVYSPCGIGGSPGGVMWGLKQVFGDAAHSFMVEPTHSPAVLLGLITGEMNKICVQDFGLDNHTEADGLAVGRPSAFASSFISKLVSGIYTIEDSKLKPLIKKLYATENIFVEPSATAGLIGPEIVLKSEYIRKQGINPADITHVVWSTGGGLVPAELRDKLTI